MTTTEKHQLATLRRKLTITERKARQVFGVYVSLAQTKLPERHAMRREWERLHCEANRLEEAICKGVA